MNSAESPESTAARKGWRVVKLGTVLTEAEGGFASGERDPSGAVQLRMNNVTNRGTFDWSSLTRVPADSKTIETYALCPGDVLFNNTNSTALVGKSVLFEAYHEPVVFSNHFTRLRSSEHDLAPEFLAYWLQLQWQQHVFANICNRWIGQSAVQRGKLLALDIALPPLKEQKRIAAILNEQMTAVETARVAATAQLTAGEALTATYLRLVFDGSEARLWPNARMEEIAKTTSGATPPRGNPAYFGGAIPWVKTAELRDNAIVGAEEHVTDLALKDCSLPLSPSGTLLIAMYGQGQTRGRTGLLSIPATTNQACFAILPNPSKFDSRFLQYWFRHNYQRLRRETEGRGGSQPNLNGMILRDLMVPLPPVTDQKRIVNLLSDELTAVSKLIASITDRLAAISVLPATLLSRAFSGEL